MIYLWYDPHDLLTHNALFNFVIGNRGSGKTYSAKKWAIKSFLKHGNQFIYLRRYKTEFKDFDKFFSDIQHEFEDHELKVKGKTVYIDGDVAGYGIPLSTALTRKSVSYDKVDKIIFDEFVIDSKVIHYLSNEVTAFLEFYETVARMRDNVRALFLSNAVSVVNPYFLYWNIRPNMDKRFNKYNHIIVESVKNDEFIKQKYNTKFGQIIKGTNYAKYAVENEYLKDNDNFIEKRPATAKFYFAIMFNGYTYGLWLDYKSGQVYFSEDFDPSTRLIFVLSDHEHKPNTVLIKRANKSHLLSGMMKAYETGNLRFDDVRVKNQALQIIGMLKAG